MNCTASIVVPTYRRNDLLRSCLERLVAQAFEPAGYEIIIADDAGDPTTEALVVDFADTARCAVRCVTVGPAHGPAAARNAGWRAAQGRVIAFTDDDCQPDSKWLQEGVKTLDETGAAAAAGTVIVPLPEQPTDYERDCAGLSRGEFVTANCFCLRDVLSKIGGFDERFELAWREDSDLQFTLLERGEKLVAAVDAIVIHPVRPASWGVSLKQQRKTAFNALLYKKHRALYRERIRPMPVSYYLSAATIVSAAVGAAAGALPVALLSAATWAGLTLRFCRKRLQGASRAPSHIAEMVVTSALIPLLSLYWHIRGMLRQRVWFQ